MSKKRRRFTAGVQEASGAGSAAGTGHGAGHRDPARGASEPGERLEAAGGGGPRRGVLAGSEAGLGARVDDPGSAREDRRTDGGAGIFFCAGWGAEPGGASRDDRARRRVVPGATVRVARREPIIAVLHAGGGERGEPGVDAASGRAALGASVLRQPADGAAPAPRGHRRGPASGAASDGSDGAGRRSTVGRGPACRTRNIGSTRTCCGMWRSTGRTGCGAPTSPISLSRRAFSTWWR